MQMVLEANDGLNQPSWIKGARCLRPDPRAVGGTLLWQVR